MAATVGVGEGVGDGVGLGVGVAVAVACVTGVGWPLLPPLRKNRVPKAPSIMIAKTRQTMPATINALLRFSGGGVMPPGRDP